jgi:hypothetical protein
MCDNYDYVHIADWVVKKTRRQHECGSCSRMFPAGITMRAACGKTEGQIGVTYCCAACDFAGSQPEHGPLHLCWGWGYDNPYDWGQETWDYINFCLDNGETPTLTGLEGALAQHAELMNA